MDYYFKLIIMQQSMFADFLQQQKMMKKSAVVRKAKMVVMTVKWGNSSNAVDSGVYLMRHLEAFMGDTSHKWTCGMTINAPKKMNLLRVRYCATLIGWDLNFVKTVAISESEKYYKDVCQDSSLNVEHILLG